MDPRKLVESKLDDLLKIAFDATNSNVGGCLLECWKLTKSSFRFNCSRRPATTLSEPLLSFGQNS